MNENVTPDEVLPGEVDLFPTLTLISEDFVGEDGIDFEGLTTEQLLSAVRESYLMHHQALQELAASMQTLGLFLGHLDDRVESLLAFEGPEVIQQPAKPAIVLPTLKQD